MLKRGRIRLLESRDVGDLVLLCREHAAYERASWREHERETQLEAIFLGSNSAHCWVVEGQDELAGFLSASLELSTWDAARYIHMDCLYLRAAYRGEGFGQRLLECVVRWAQEENAVNVQWQTPAWNADAARFYERLGARAEAKLRYTLTPAGMEDLLANREDL